MRNRVKSRKEKSSIARCFRDRFHRPRVISERALCAARERKVVTFFFFSSSDSILLFALLLISLVATIPLQFRAIIVVAITLSMRGDKTCFALFCKRAGKECRGEIFSFLLTHLFLIARNRSSFYFYHICIYT